MNVIFPNSNGATRGLPFSQRPERPFVPAPAGVLSTSELKQIVAAMLG